jgi:hypothetical protein
MIIKSLLFIIICIFCYETYRNINKMTEEYFTQLNIGKDTDIHTNTNTKETFIKITGNPDYDSIASTIAINCNAYPSESSKIMTYQPEPDDILDTPYYAQFKPIEYNKNRDYFWRRDKLIEEGIRRSEDDDIEIKKIQNLFDNETDDDKKLKYQDELNLFTWRKNIFSMNDANTGISREKRDIISDYYPAEIGLQRPWIERHSHIPDYSY